MDKTRQNRAGNRGANLLEFTLVGIPIIFILISVFEISRGMWLYQTAAHASRETARYIVVHGANCLDEACGRTISDIATELSRNLVGLDPSEVRVTFRSGCTLQGNFRNACANNTDDSQTGAKTLATLMADNSMTDWPGITGDTDSKDFVEVELRFPFRSAIAMFWPGAGGGQNFGTVQMFAASREMFQF